MSGTRPEDGGATSDEEEDDEDEEEEEFMSVGTHLSRCSSAASFEAFFSAKTTSCLSRCSSLGRIEFPEYRRRSSIILEFSHCEGWPFGLCRKAVLLPPLPKSPSDSWLWRNKTTGSGRPSSFKMH
nr:uncharacterized protein LOC109170639 [Ipomoea batatas]